MERPLADHPVAESRALTGLRGIAALLVVVHHFQLRLRIDQYVPLVRWLLQKGYLGVDLFFVLSGFVLSMTYATWFDGRRGFGLQPYLHFLSRRIARLWPLHAVVILALIAFAAQTLPLTRNNVFANLTMIQAWGISAEINPPAWSVSTEFLAYVLFPLLVGVVLRGRIRPWLAALGVLMAIAACLYFAPPLGPGRRGWLDIYFNYSVLPALRCLAGFTTGMLAWRAARTPTVRRFATAPWTGPAALALVLVFMLGRVNDLLILPLLPIVVLGMHFGRGPVQSALGRNPLHRLGILSYAVYLIHFALLRHFPFTWGPLGIILILYIVTTLGLAAAAYLLVEAPARRLLRTLGDRLLAPRTPAAIPP